MGSVMRATPSGTRAVNILYFSASTDIGLGADWLNMSSINRPVTRGIYAAVLSQKEPSPIAHESDEEKPQKTPEKAETAKDDAAKKDTEKTPEVRIDFEGLGQRIIALPIPQRNYRESPRRQGG